MELVAVTHQAAEHLGALVVHRGARIDLGVQIQLGEQELGHTLVGAGIAVAAGSCERAVVDQVVQFLLKPVEKVGKVDLVGEGTHHARLVSERHVAEVVDGVVVSQGAEHAGLGDEFFLVGETHVGSLRFADELVGSGHLHEDAGVERVDERVVRRPVHIVEILDGLVVPAADRLVGRQFAVVIQTADVLRGTSVKTGDGSTSVGTVVARGGEARIDTRQEGSEGGLVDEGLVRRVGVRVDRRDIEVTDAGGQRGRDGKDAENIFDRFHISRCIRS